MPALTPSHLLLPPATLLYHLLATSSAPADTFLTHNLMYDVDEEDYAKKAALVAGAMLDEDDQPAPEPINAIIQLIDAPLSRKIRSPPLLPHWTTLTCLT